MFYIWSAGQGIVIHNISIYMIKRLTIQIVQVMQTLLIDYAFIQSIFIFSHGGLHMKMIFLRYKS